MTLELSTIIMSDVEATTEPNVAQHGGYVDAASQFVAHHSGTGSAVAATADASKAEGTAEGVTPVNKEEKVSKKDVKITAEPVTSGVLGYKAPGIIRYGSMAFIVQFCRILHLLKVPSRASRAITSGLVMNPSTTKTSLNTFAVRSNRMRPTLMPLGRPKLARASCTLPNPTRKRRLLVVS